MTILRLITPATAATVKVMTDWKSDFLTGYTRELNIGLMMGHQVAAHEKVSVIFEIVVVLVAN